ncbi:hypothetical protein ACVNF4_26265 [Streptomyces sp. S6]
MRGPGRGGGSTASARWRGSDARTISRTVAVRDSRTPGGPVLTPST